MVNASEGEHPRVTRVTTMKLFTALAALTLIAAPVQAGMNDAETLMDMIESTGTTISFNNNHYDENCLGSAGYYVF